MSDGKLIELKIDDKDLAKLLDMARRAGRLRPVMALAGETIVASVVKNFEVGGRYSEPGSAYGGSRKWQPLALATLFAKRPGQKGSYLETEYSGNAKERMYKKLFKARRTKDDSIVFRKNAEDRLKNRKILVQSGRLLNSITSRAGDDSVTIGSNVVYAAIQNFGGQAGRGKKVYIPARPYLVVQAEDIEEIKRGIAEFLLKGTV